MMLQHSFVQFTGVGEKTEERLWRQGVLTWDDYLARPKADSYTKRYDTQIRAAIDEARRALDGGALPHFLDLFRPKNPRKETRSRHLWRAFAEFQDHAVVYAGAVAATGARPKLVALLRLGGGGERLFVAGRDLDTAFTDIDGGKDLVVMATPGAIQLWQSEFGKTKASAPNPVLSVDDIFEYFRLNEAPLLERNKDLLRYGKLLGLADVESEEQVGSEEIASLWRAVEAGDTLALDAIHHSLLRVAKAAKPFLATAVRALRASLIPELAERDASVRDGFTLAPGLVLSAPSADSGDLADLAGA